MAASDTHFLRTMFVTVLAAAAGAGAAVVGMRAWIARKGRDSRSSAVTRVEAHLASTSANARVTPASSMALRRDVQRVFETKEATRDLEVLDRLLRDIRDLSSAEEAIFWRWVETRQALVPSAWSTEAAERPAFFDVRAWGALVRWSAEANVVQFAGEAEDAPVLAAVPVLGTGTIYGVLTLTAAGGLRLDRDSARSWMPRFAAQVAGLLQLFDLRREYGRHMRQSEALLDAVKRLHGHRGAEALSQALCDTARDVTSATVAGLVRWNAAEKHGVVQAISPSSEIEPGFHVTADSLVGRVCVEGLRLVLEDAAPAVIDGCPYGGLPRPIGSAAIIPIIETDHAIGAIVVEGKMPGDVSQHEARNVGLLAAVARGPLEIVWEIEEVSLRARTDPLTGLANRRHFDEQLRRVVTETDRFGGACSLILLDLDQFKQVNDRFGHEAGDAVLKHVARLLSETVRAVDLCARYGGEEIGVLLPQTAEQGAVELAERLRATLEARPSLYAGRPIGVTASFGVATYPAPVPSGELLVASADKALYEAKASGRNCVKVALLSDVASALYKGRA
ncbi:MAG: diguanylate cyclase [Gemmatimonadales bacterium]